MRRMQTWGWRVALVLLGLSPASARADCPPSLALEGPVELVARVTVALEQREIYPQTVRPGCAPSRARITQEGAGYRVTFWPEVGTERSRPVLKLSTAVSLLESWTRTDLDPFLAAAEDASLVRNPPPVTPLAELRSLPSRRVHRVSLDVEGVGDALPRAGARVGVAMLRGLFELGGAVRVRAYFPDGWTPGRDGLQTHALASLGVPFGFPGGNLFLTPTLRAGLGVVVLDSSFTPGQKSGSLGAAVDAGLVFRQSVGPRLGYLVEAVWEQTIPLWKSDRAATWVSRGRRPEGAFAVHLGVTFALF